MATTMVSHVSQSAEVKFAQRLAANEKNLRDRAIRKLQKWMVAKSSSKNGFTQDDFLKIWKGLYYCMWMSDKPLVQEELASNLSSLIHCFDKAPHQGMMFYRVCLRTIAREWSLLDKWRVNKFMMLIRCCLSQAFVYIKKHDWPITIINDFTCAMYDEILSTPVISPCPEEVQLHFTDIYIDELDETCGDEMPSHVLVNMMEPFCKALINASSQSFLMHVADMFMSMLTEADAMKQNDGEDESMNSTDLKLQFDFTAVADRLFHHLSHDDILSKNRRVIQHIVRQYRSFIDGTYRSEPVVSTNDTGDAIKRDDINKAVERLEKLELKMKMYKKPPNKKKFYEMLIKDDETNDNDAHDPQMYELKIVNMADKVNKNVAKKQKINNEKCASHSLKKRASSSLHATTLHLENRMEADDNSPAMCRGKGRRMEPDLENVKRREIKKTKKDQENLAKDENVNVNDNKKGKKRKAPTSQSTSVHTNTQSSEKRIRTDEDNNNNTSIEQCMVRETSGGGGAENRIKVKVKPMKAKRVDLQEDVENNNRAKKKNVVTSTPRSSKKRVSFGMHKNMSLDFDQSVNFSPGLPFNPKDIPEQSILKATPPRPSPIQSLNRRRICGFTVTDM